MESGKQAAMQAEGASSTAAGASGLRGLVTSAALALGLLLIAWAGARDVLLTHSVFAFNDGNIEAVLSPSSTYPDVLVARWDNQFFFGKPGGTVPLTLNALSETLLGPVGHRRTGVVLATWLAGLAGLWCCRQFGLGRLASAFGALLVMLCGWSVTFPTVGLPVRTYTLAFALFSIGWIERGRRRGGWLPYAVGGGLLGLGVSETPDVGIMFAVGCAFFFLAGHILLLFRDMTQIRRLETVRQDFISNISHELRTPLASLKALTETLMDGALDDPPAAKRFLTRIETEVDSLSLMVQELLELARIESGKVPLILKPVQPGQLVETAVERLYLQAERAGLNVFIEAPANLPMVLADPPRMEQVLMNLVHNAIKFTPDQGNIHISASQGKGQHDGLSFSG